jgi:DNA polymerase-3 subunit delta
MIAHVSDKAKSQFYDRLKRESVAVPFAPLNASDLPGWLIARADADGFELKLDAARALAGAIGSDLGVLVQELRKLYNYVGANRKQITAEDVAHLVGSLPRQNRWEWFDLVGDRKFSKARARLQILLDSGETAVGLVIGLGTHFLRLGIAAHGGERALESVLPPHQRWLASRIAKQAAGWSREEVDDLLADLLRADRLLKSTSLSENQVMEELLLRAQTRAAVPV